MKIKIKLMNKARLEIVNYYFKKAVNITIDSITYIEYYNALQIYKKFSDVIFKRTITPSPGAINVSIDINEFTTFVEITRQACHNADAWQADIFTQILFTDIIQSGNKQTAQIAHQHEIQASKKNEIL